MKVKVKSKTWLDKKGVREATVESADRRLGFAALSVEREAKLSMKEGGRSGKFGIGTPSAPGQPPHSQSGTLKSSIRTARERHGLWVIGPTFEAFYGRAHEFGARIKVTEKMRNFLHRIGMHLKASTTKIIIPKRPFMRPALFKAAKNFPKFFKGLRLDQTRAGRAMNLRGNR